MERHHHGDHSTTRSVLLARQAPQRQRSIARYLVVMPQKKTTLTKTLGKRSKSGLQTRLLLNVVSENSPQSRYYILQLLISILPQSQDSFWRRVG